MKQNCEKKGVLLYQRSLEKLLGWSLTVKQGVGERNKSVNSRNTPGNKNLSCPRDEFWISLPKCYDMINKKHKFYLSFKNALSLYVNSFVINKIVTIIKCVRFFG